MVDYKHIEFLKELVKGATDKRSRIALIIELARDDDFDATDIFTVINDSILFKEFSPLIEKLGGIEKSNADLAEIHRLSSHGHEDLSTAQDALDAICEMVGGLRNVEVVTNG